CAWKGWKEPGQAPGFLLASVAGFVGQCRQNRQWLFSKLLARFNPSGARASTEMLLEGFDVIWRGFHLNLWRLRPRGMRGAGLHVTRHPNAPRTRGPCSNEPRHRPTFVPA